MTPTEIRTALLAGMGKRVRITYVGGTAESVDVDSVDDEGVLHSGPDGIEPPSWWARFESIVEVTLATDT